MKYLFLLVFIMYLVACGTLSPKNKIEKYRRNYKFTDISGDFILNFESGLSKGKEAYVKKRLIGEKDNKEYEKLVTISRVGSLIAEKRKIRALRPKISQYTVWLGNQKYFSQLEVIPEEKMLKVKMDSPEKEWKGVRGIPFENSRGVFCFFSQVADCVKVTGFLERAIESKAGKMSFTIIWEGYPFMDQQYPGVNGPFSTSIFTYDGLSSEGDFIFNLSFEDQVLFYHFNKDMNLEKKFWVSQGMTQVGI